MRTIDEVNAEGISTVMFMETLIALGRATAENGQSFDDCGMHALAEASARYCDAILEAAEHIQGRLDTLAEEFTALSLEALEFEPTLEEVEPDDTGTDVQ